MRSTFRILALTIAALFVFATTQQAQAQFGIAAGANFNQMTDITGDRTATFDNVSGYHVGIFYDFSAGALAVRPGLFYMNVGTFGVEGDPTIDEVDFDLFEVPLDLRVRVVATPAVRPYLMAGPTLRIARSGDDDVQDALSNLSVAANAGVGVELGIPGTSLRFFPELRYAFGLTRFADSADLFGIEFEDEDAFQLNTFMLRLGLTF